MQLEKILEGAKKDAKKSGVPIAVIYDPITTAEQNGNYGYAPEAVWPVLYRYGALYAVVTPDGAVNLAEKRPGPCRNCGQPKKDLGATCSRCKTKGE